MQYILSSIYNLVSSEVPRDKIFVDNIAIPDLNSLEGL